MHTRHPGAAGLGLRTQNLVPDRRHAPRGDPRRQAQVRRRDKGQFDRSRLLFFSFTEHFRLFSCLATTFYSVELLMVDGGAGRAEKVHPGTADEQGRQLGAQSRLQVLLPPAYENLLLIEV